MTATPSHPLPRPAPLVWWPVLLLVLVGAAAYVNTLRSPLVFDDRDIIERNPTIQHLADSFFPPVADGMTVSGRPLVNVTLALDYAVSGTGVWTYHLTNIVIHLLGGLALYGLLRRVLPEDRLRPDGAARPGPIGPALVGTLLWLLHPLQTESVGYIAQRAESLAGLFLLFTVYAFARSAEAGTVRAVRSWQSAAVAACLGGMFSKETMVVAPVLVFLYDRTFVAGTFSAAWKRRRAFYVSLAATWIALAWLVVESSGRGGTAGFAAKVSPWDYFLTQCWAVAHYLRLVFWPRPLIFDYGEGLILDWAQVVLPALLLVVLGLITLVALRRWPRAGFAGAAFFLLLAPSSSFVPVATQTVAEHRMYLALAPVLVLVLAGLWRRFGTPALWTGLIWALVLGVLTVNRNRVYQDELGLWTDTVAKRPDSARAHANLGKTLSERGRDEEALVELEESLRLTPEQPGVQYNAGLSLADLGRSQEAIPHYREAVRLDPKYVDARFNLGLLLMESGQLDEALPQLQEAARLAPDRPDVLGGWGSALAQVGRLDEAESVFKQALQLQPAATVAAQLHFNLGNVLLLQNQPEAAITEYSQSVELDPQNAAAQFNLGVTLFRSGQSDRAVAPLQAALRLEPGFTTARDLLSRIGPAPAATPSASR